MEKNNLLCKQCEFYNKNTDSCKATNVINCSQSEIIDCKDFLVKEKLVHF